MIAIAMWFYIFLAWAPLWWPALIALRSRPKLPRQLLFVGVVAALSYGIVFLPLCALVLPAGIYSLFVAPGLQQMAHPYGAPIVSITQYIEQYGWLVLPPALLVFTFILTHKLAKFWSRICESFRG